MNAASGGTGARLAIRAPNWVGDLVMATPVFEAALASARWREVHIVVRGHLLGVLADAPWAARVQPIAREGDERELYARLAPDAVLLLSNSFGAAWRALRARVPVRVGAALNGRRWLLTHAVVPPTRAGRRVPIPSAHLMRDVALLGGIEVSELHPRLFAREEVVSATRALLERLGIARGTPYVLCCPGAAFGSAKLWPTEHFARALDRLHELYGLRAVLSGGPGEEALLDAVARMCRHPALSLARERRDLENLKALVADARLVLVGDSGPRWYAAAYDVPCVSILGPNSPELTASSLEHAAIVRLEGLECSPCLQRRCPLGHHRCMRELDPERAVAAARELFERPRSAAAARSSIARGAGPAQSTLPMQHPVERPVQPPPVQSIDAR